MDAHATIEQFAKENGALEVAKLCKWELLELANAGQLVKGPFVTEAGGAREPYWPLQVFALVDDGRVVWCMESESESPVVSLD